ncbi:MAG: ribosome assembly cofactor RimP [Treponema sp.]|nr:ribosome assembly cofactor RimP [Treponema sp.]
MRWAGKEENQETASVRQQLKTVLDGLKYDLLELVISRSRGNVQVRVVIYNGKSIGTDDCAKVHRCVMPRLEIALNSQDVHLEVSSPGIDRLIKDSAEFAFYKGRGVRCYRTDINDWSQGLLESADEKGIIIKTNKGALNLAFDIIAKAKLDSGVSSVSGSSQEV